MFATADLRLFVHTAHTGNLSRAARTLDLQPAAASAALKRLEAQLGCRLFERSTRAMRLTGEGEQFLDSCRRALALLDEGVELLAAGRGQIAGSLRVTTPADCGRQLLVPIFHDFQAAHPQLRLLVQCQDRMSDLYHEGFDLAFRNGKLSASSLVAQLIAPSRRLLVAAPSYLRAHGSPRSLDELAAHNCVLYNTGKGWRNIWRLRQGRKAVEIEVSGDRMTDDGGLMREWAVAGAGIAYKSALDVRADLQAGRLVQLLPELTGEDASLHVVYPHRLGVSPAMRALVDYVRARLRQA
ncbi:LysR family transcriptional regulator [Massilia sp. TS11]|uniref:LysR family transcriptional regulator n=1 Tax=Massilia sp. TS11 TaxID=2908003 RepID=UPI001EDB095E|nr:LysR family transcriptional regulator [Massilia sp. TS11]MCG2584421.1 LysR family transcriptional regulator [Massilia sp. TS11]